MRGTQHVATRRGVELYQGQDQSTCPLFEGVLTILWLAMEFHLISKSQGGFFLRYEYMHM